VLRGLPLPVAECERFNGGLRQPQTLPHFCQKSAELVIGQNPLDVPREKELVLKERNLSGGISGTADEVSPRGKAEFLRGFDHLNLRLTGDVSALTVGPFATARLNQRVRVCLKTVLAFGSHDELVASVAGF